MEVSLIERLKAAIEDGEFLTVVYLGGHAPGQKRRILPIRIAQHILYARSAQSMLVKSYLLEKVSVVSEDHPAQWMVESSDRVRATKIDPASFFSDWAYEIDRPLWPALGVTLREYVAKANSTSSHDSVLQNLGEINVGRSPSKYLAYAIGNPPQFDFQEGDLFFPKDPSVCALQVVANRKLIEVHQIPRSSSDLRKAYQLIDDELVAWLKTGLIPTYSRIDPALSFSEVLRFGIASIDIDAGQSLENHG